MSTRISSAILLLALTGCHGVQDDGEAIACAIGAGSHLAQDCRVERSNADGYALLTVRHPDGGFRRFRVMGNGHILPNDGSETVAVTSVDGGLVDITVAGARYRLRPVAHAQDRKP